MGIHPHGYLGGPKAHRRIIIKDKAGKLKDSSYLNKNILFFTNTKTDKLGILIASSVILAQELITSLCIELPLGNNR